MRSGMKIITRRILNSSGKSTNTESGTGQLYKKTRVTEWTLELRSEDISDTALKTCSSDQVTRKLQQNASSTSRVSLPQQGSIPNIPFSYYMVAPSFPILPTPRPSPRHQKPCTIITVIIICIYLFIRFVSLPFLSSLTMPAGTFS